jgi:hypothetical protein
VALGNAVGGNGGRGNGGQVAIRLAFTYATPTTDKGKLTGEGVAS